MPSPISSLQFPARGVSAFTTLPRPLAATGCKSSQLEHDLEDGRTFTEGLWLWWGIQCVGNSCGPDSLYRNAEAAKMPQTFFSKLADDLRCIISYDLNISLPNLIFSYKVLQVLVKDNCSIMNWRLVRTLFLKLLRQAPYRIDKWDLVCIFMVKLFNAVLSQCLSRDPSMERDHWLPAHTELTVFPV